MMVPIKPPFVIPEVKGWQGWGVLGLIGFMLVALVVELASPYLVMMGTLTILLAFSIIDVPAAFRGFSDPAVISVAILFIVAKGIETSGGLEYVASVLFRVPNKSKRRSLGYFSRRTEGSIVWVLLKFTVPVAMFSAFLANIPLVAMMIPPIVEFGNKMNLPPSKMLMPLSYAAQLGGTMTLIGASTNLIVLSMAATKLPNLHMSLFEIGIVGLPITIAGILYIVVFSGKLLPERAATQAAVVNAREYNAVLAIKQISKLARKSIELSGLGRLPGLNLVAITRDFEMIRDPSPDFILEPNDKLHFVGVVDSVLLLAQLRGLALTEDEGQGEVDLNQLKASQILVEAVIAPGSSMVKERVADLQCRTRFNSVIMAIHRHGRRLISLMGDIRVEAGDCLLMVADNSEFIGKHRISSHFALVSQLPGFKPINRKKALIASTLVIAMVVASGVGVELVRAALYCAAGLLLTRCLTPQDAMDAIELPVLIMIAAAFGIAEGMVESGAATILAKALMGLAGTSMFGLISCTYVATTLFSLAITNSAAVTIMFPVALAAANRQSLDFRPFAYTLMMAASAGFMTPTACPSNLMVYSPGSYKFSDYIHYGAPLQLWLLFVTVGVTMSHKYWYAWVIVIFGITCGATPLIAMHKSTHPKPVAAVEATADSKLESQDHDDENPSNEQLPDQDCAFMLAPGHENEESITRRMSQTNFPTSSTFGSSHSTTYPSFASSYQLEDSMLPPPADNSSISSSSSTQSSKDSNRASLFPSPYRLETDIPIFPSIRRNFSLKGAQLFLENTQPTSSNDSTSPLPQTDELSNPPLSAFPPPLSPHLPWPSIHITKLNSTTFSPRTGTKDSRAGGSIPALPPPPPSFPNRSVSPKREVSGDEPASAFVPAQTRVPLLSQAQSVSMPLQTGSKGDLSDVDRKKLLGSVVTQAVPLFPAEARPKITENSAKSNQDYDSLDKIMNIEARELAVNNAPTSPKAVTSFLNQSAFPEIEFPDASQTSTSPQSQPSPSSSAEAATSYFEPDFTRAPINDLVLLPSPTSTQRRETIYFDANADLTGDPGVPSSMNAFPEGDTNYFDPHASRKVHDDRIVGPSVKRLPMPNFELDPSRDIHVKASPTPVLDNDLVSQPSVRRWPSPSFELDPSRDMEAKASTTRVPDDDLNLQPSARRWPSPSFEFDSSRNFKDKGLPEVLPDNYHVVQSSGSRWPVTAQSSLKRQRLPNFEFDSSRDIHGDAPSASIDSKVELEVSQSIERQDPSSQDLSPTSEMDFDSETTTETNYTPSPGISFDVGDGESSLTNAKETQFVNLDLSSPSEINFNSLNTTDHSFPRSFINPEFSPTSAVESDAPNATEPEFASTPVATPELSRPSEAKFDSVSTTEADSTSAPFVNLDFSSTSQAKFDSMEATETDFTSSPFVNIDLSPTSEVNFDSLNNKETAPLVSLDLSLTSQARFDSLNTAEADFTSAPFENLDLSPASQLESNSMNTKETEFTSAPSVNLDLSSALQVKSNSVTTTETDFTSAPFVNLDLQPTSEPESDPLNTTQASTSISALNLDPLPTSEVNFGPSNTTESKMTLSVLNLEVSAPPPYIRPVPTVSYPFFDSLHSFINQTGETEERKALPESNISFPQTQLTPKSTPESSNPDESNAAVTSTQEEPHTPADPLAPPHSLSNINPSTSQTSMVVDPGTSIDLDLPLPFSQPTTTAENFEVQFEDATSDASIDLDLPFSQSYPIRAENFEVPSTSATQSGDSESSVQLMPYRKDQQLSSDGRAGSRSVAVGGRSSQSGESRPPQQISTALSSASGSSVWDPLATAGEPQSTSGAKSNIGPFRTRQPWQQTFSPSLRPPFPSMVYSPSLRPQSQARRPDDASDLQALEDSARSSPVSVSPTSSEVEATAGPSTTEQGPALSPPAARQSTVTFNKRQSKARLSRYLAPTKSPDRPRKISRATSKSIARRKSKSPRSGSTSSRGSPRAKSIARPGSSSGSASSSTSNRAVGADEEDTTAGISTLLSSRRLSSLKDTGSFADNLG